MLISDLPRLDAVKVGSLYLKPKDVQETITRCCRMVLLEADDPTLPIGRTGSAMLIRFRNSNYIVTTRHELSIQRSEMPSKEILDTIRISSGSDILQNIPIHRCIYEISNSDQEYHDILIFEPVKSWETQNADRPYFFPIAPFSKASRRISMLAGYPTIEGVMEEYLESFIAGENGPIHIKRAISDCDIDTHFTSSSDHFRSYIHRKPRPHMDGYSGGAVFSLIGEVETLEIVLDGIVVRGGRDRVNIVDVDYLIKAVST